MSEVKRTATKRRYELLEGVHYERRDDWMGHPRDPGRFIVHRRDPRSSGPGPIIESTENLAVKWVGKFRLVSERQPQPITEQRRRFVAELISKDVFPEEDRTFLEELSDDGFARVMKYAKIPTDTIGRPLDPTVETEDGKVIPTDELQGKPKKSRLGEDVTGKFQKAYDNGFKVYVNAQGRHQVIRGSQKPLNPEPLDASQVDPFVETYLAENPT